jgi:hypothetical protein
MRPLKFIDYDANNNVSSRPPIATMARLYPKLILLIATLLLSNASYAANFDVREYTLKAVFLERFTRFIDWPEDTSQNNSPESFIINVMGNPEFSALLRNIYQTQEIQGKKVSIQDINNPDEIQKPHLLFISHTSDETLNSILELTRDTPTLTISDTEGFAEKGVMINFFMSRNKKIRFEINELAFKESELYISYKLLSVAKIVGEE